MRDIPNPRLTPQNCSPDIYYNILNADLLIIDDLGVEYMNDWMLSKLFVIVNERMKNELPIIITTNYELEQLKQRLSIPNKVCETTNSIISRLYEMCYRVECRGNDYRMN